MSKYSQFSLFSVAMLYKVTTKTVSEYGAISPMENGGLGFYKPLVTKFLATDQYITLFYMGLCLKTTCFIYIVHS